MEIPQKDVDLAVRLVQSINIKQYDELVKLYNNSLDSVQCYEYIRQIVPKPTLYKMRHLTFMAYGLDTVPFCLSRRPEELIVTDEVIYQSRQYKQRGKSITRIVSHQKNTLFIGTPEEANKFMRKEFGTTSIVTKKQVSAYLRSLWNRRKKYVKNYSSDELLKLMVPKENPGNVLDYFANKHKNSRKVFSEGADFTDRDFKILLAGVSA